MSLSLNFPTTNPSLMIDFVNRSTLDSRVTFTRASTATYFDSSGVITTAAANVPRFDYNPSTLQPRGLLIEEQRTNSIRNNTMQGAVAGTPGTLPTNWVALATAGGITREIVGIGTVDGISYIDIRYSGTTTDANSVNLAFDGNSAIAASSGQTWTSSSYLTVVGGNFTNITSAVVRVTERTGAGGFVGTTEVSFSSASGSLRQNRFSVARTLGATAGAVQGNIFLNIASGVAIDITLRIGLPQLEQGAFATSVIPTTTTALTRNADVASMTGTNFSSWFNASQGTLLNQFSVIGYQSTLAFPSSSTISDNTNSNRYSLANTNTGANLYSYAEIASGGVTQAGFFGASGSAFGVNAVRKVALTYATNDCAFTTQGLSAQTDTSVTLPTVDRLYIGLGATGSGPINGHIQRIAYYPTRLANAQLQALTL